MGGGGGLHIGRIGRNNPGTNTGFSVWERPRLHTPHVAPDGKILASMVQLNINSNQELMLALLEHYFMYEGKTIEGGGFMLWGEAPTIKHKIAYSQVLIEGGGFMLWGEAPTIKHKIAYSQVLIEGGDFMLWDESPAIK